MSQHQLKVLVWNLGQLTERGDIQVLEGRQGVRLGEPVKPRQGRDGEGSEERLLSPGPNLAQLKRRDQCPGNAGDQLGVGDPCHTGKIVLPCHLALDARSRITCQAEETTGTCEVQKQMTGLPWLPNRRKALYDFGETSARLMNTDGIGR